VDLTPEIALGNNLILLGGPSENLWASKFEALFPLKFLPNDAGFQLGPRTYSAPNTGAIFLSPWANAHLAVVIAGNDMGGFWRAFQAFPTHTGHMVPDYMVVGKSFGWAGAGGVLAAGYWNNLWQFDYSCGYAK